MPTRRDHSHQGSDKVLQLAEEKDAIPVQDIASALGFEQDGSNESLATSDDRKPEELINLEIFPERLNTIGNVPMQEEFVQNEPAPAPVPAPAPLDLSDQELDTRLEYINQGLGFVDFTACPKTDQGDYRHGQRSVGEEYGGIVGHRMLFVGNSLGRSHLRFTKQGYPTCVYGRILRSTIYDLITRRQLEIRTDARVFGLLATLAWPGRLFYSKFGSTLVAVFRRGVMVHRFASPGPRIFLPSRSGSNGRSCHGDGWRGGSVVGCTGT